MAIYRCKMCGGDLQIEAGSSVCVCEYCGTKQTVPSADSEKKMTLFARANRILRDCEFDKAAGVFESIIADFPNEAEAYWGLVLCKYGIEYVDDPATGRKVPTCHRSSFDIVMDDANYQLAIKNADVVAKEIYRSEGAQIEELRRDILEISSREEPYDIFICYKETDEKGERTLDSVLAQDIYDALIDKGYRVFFSRITLEDMLGTEFEPHIFAALRSAKVMLAFGTKPEHFDAVWVKNEWSRFLSMMEKGENKYLIPCYKNMDPYDMPKEFARLQAQDLGKVGAVQDLLRGIDKILVPQKTVKIETKEPQKWDKWKKYIPVAAGALVLIIVLAIIFGGNRGSIVDVSVPSVSDLTKPGLTSDQKNISLQHADGDVVNVDIKKSNNGSYQVNPEVIGQYFTNVTMDFFGTPNLGNDLDAYIQDSYAMASLVATGDMAGKSGAFDPKDDPNSTFCLLIWQWYNDELHLTGYFIGVPEKINGSTYRLAVTTCDYDATELLQKRTDSFRKNKESIYANYVAPDTAAKGDSSAKYYIRGYNDGNSNVPEENEIHMAHLWMEYDSKYRDVYARDVSRMKKEHVDFGKYKFCILLDKDFNYFAYTAIDGRK